MKEKYQGIDYVPIELTLKAHSKSKIIKFRLLNEIIINKDD